MTPRSHEPENFLMSELTPTTDVLVTKQELRASTEILIERLTLRFGILLAIAIYFVVIILL
jgi:hypothetical protein